MHQLWAVRATRILATLILASAVLAGCGSGGDVVGKYKAQIDMPAGKENDPMAGLAKSMAEAASLELKADKTFVLTMMFPIEGTYTVSGGTVELTMTKMMGMSMDDAAKMGNKAADSKKPMRFSIEDGGKTLIALDTKAGDPQMKFVRS